ncbi:MAG: lipoyl(octanoyl) transferase LipB [Myxococcota bacterium]
MKVTLLGRVGYEPGLELQRAARERVLAGGEDECLLLEHDPVVTLGKRGGAVDREALERLATPVIATERGGFATWHGPGQLVGYPIVDTRRARIGVRELVTRLGDVMIGIASDLGLEGVTYDVDRPGVYREGRKLGSIGLHLTHGVSMHGFAINVTNSLDGFRAIVPCGYGDLAVTTIAAELGRDVAWDAAVASAKQRVIALVPD